jgi:hypothetical protein
METEPRLAIIVQRWECYVTEIEEDTFWAVLQPVIGEGPDQIAEIKKSSVEPGSRDRIKTGAYFYWSIGYVSQEDFEKEKGTSIIWFPGPVLFTKEEIEEAEKKAEEWAKLFEESDG